MADLTVASPEQMRGSAANIASCTTEHRALHKTLEACQLELASGLLGKTSEAMRLKLDEHLTTSRNLLNALEEANTKLAQAGVKYDAADLESRSTVQGGNNGGSVQVVNSSNQHNLNLNI